MSAPDAAIIYALDPVYGAGFSYLLLGETLGPQGAAGAGLALTCLYLPYISPKSISTPYLLYISPISPHISGAGLVLLAVLLSRTATPADYHPDDDAATPAGDHADEPRTGCKPEE